MVGRFGPQAAERPAPSRRRGYLRSSGRRTAARLPVGRWSWRSRLHARILRSFETLQETGEQTDQRMSKPGSSATDMRKRALEVPAFGALAAFWHVGVLPADREFCPGLVIINWCQCTTGKRKEGPGVVGPLRAPYLSTTTKRLTPKRLTPKGRPARGSGADPGVLRTSQSD